MSLEQRHPLKCDGWETVADGQLNLYILAPLEASTSGGLALVVEASAATFWCGIVAFETLAVHMIGKRTPYEAAIYQSEHDVYVAPSSRVSHAGLQPQKLGSQGILRRSCVT